MRFPIYEYLLLLNKNLQETVEVLEQIKQCLVIRKETFTYHQNTIHYLRAVATGDVLDAMNRIEHDEAYQFSKKRKGYEDSIRDLDDVYFEVQEREEQRRQQGLPSLIGILPRNTAAGTGTHSVAKEEQSGNTPKPTPAPVPESKRRSHAANRKRRMS